MIGVKFSKNQIPATTRGRIIQRVLVDGWSPAETAAAFGVHERQVTRWVAAYRRRGMASLHDVAAAESPPLRWLRRLRVIVVQFRASFGVAKEMAPAHRIALLRQDDEPPTFSKKPLISRRWN